MSNLPSLELLESTHEFPGPYMFKVIGRPEHGFVARAVAAIRESLGTELDPHYHFRQTAGGRHISLTFQPVVQDGGQVLAVYKRLKVLEGLVILW